MANGGTTHPLSETWRGSVNTTATGTDSNSSTVAMISSLSRTTSAAPSWTIKVQKLSNTKHGDKGNGTGIIPTKETTSGTHLCTLLSALSTALTLRLGPGTLPGTQNSLLHQIYSETRRLACVQEVWRKEITNTCSDRV
jgi:hypothetical protein